MRSKEYDMDNHKLTSLSFEGECKASDFLDLLKGSQNTILMIGVPHSIHWLITTISPQNNGCHNSCRLPMCRYTRLNRLSFTPCHHPRPLVLFPRSDSRGSPDHMPYARWMLSTKGRRTKHTSTTNWGCLKWVGE